MNKDTFNFMKINEAKPSKYDLAIADIRNRYKKEIPEDDVVTPVIVYQLEDLKKKLDKRWGLDGKLTVEKAYELDEDAYAYLYYKTGDITCSVHKNFRDGGGKRLSHRKISALGPGLSVSANIPHPYFEGDEVIAYLSKDMSKWEIYYIENNRKATLKAKTKNFCNLKSLEKILKKYEIEWDVFKTGYIDHT